MKLLYPLLLFPLVSFCSDKKLKTMTNDSIGFAIIEKKVYVDSSQSSFEITAVLSNPSNENFILYAFKRGFATPSDDSAFFNLSDRSGAGNAMIILDKNGNREPVIVDDCDDCEEADPISHRSDFLTILKNTVKKNYLEATEILNAKSGKEVRFKIEFSNIKLSKGEYQFYMIYYCGHDIEQIIDDITIKDDERKNNATALKGWIKSNTVKLIVE